MSDTVLTAPTAPPTANGHGPPMPRHEGWLEVDADLYPGYWVKTWTNAPKRVFLDLSSSDLPRYLDAVKALILDVKTETKERTWDVWFDADGEPLPKPTDAAFITDVPTELLVVTLRAIRARSGSVLPNLRARVKQP